MENPSTMPVDRKICLVNIWQIFCSSQCHGRRFIADFLPTMIIGLSVFGLLNNRPSGNKR